MLRSKKVHVVLLALVVLLAGCSALQDAPNPSSGEESGPSISDPRADVIQGQPYLLFNYNVEDYREVLLQHPDGNVIKRATLEPNRSSSRFEMDSPSSGTYKLILQKDGETVTEQNATFNGGNPVVQSTRADWSGNSLQEASLTVENRGDLPVRVSDPTVEVYETSVQSTSRTWIGPNETATVTVTPSYEELIVQRPGDARGTISVDTRSESLSGSFEVTFEPANLTIAEVDPTWQGNSLSSTTVVVENIGDLPTSAELLLTNNGRDVATSTEQTVPAGASTEFRLSRGTLFEQTTGGRVELGVVVDSADGFTEETITHYAEPANLSVETVETDWQNGELYSVTATVSNTGGVSAEFTPSLTVNGESPDTDIGGSSFSIGANSSSSITFERAGYGEDALYWAFTGGEFPATVSIESSAGSASKTETTAFEGPEGELTGADPLFLSEYQSDNVELSSIGFSTRNLGDISLDYDSVRITIDGVSQTESLAFAESISPGGSESENLYLDGISVSPGEHELTIELRHQGETIATMSTTVTAE